MILKNNTETLVYVSKDLCLNPKTTISVENCFLDVIHVKEKLEILLSSGILSIVHGQDNVKQENVKQENVEQEVKDKKQKKQD